MNTNNNNQSVIEYKAFLRRIINHKNKFFTYHAHNNLITQGCALCENNITNYYEIKDNIFRNYKFCTCLHEKSIEKTKKLNLKIGDYVYKQLSQETKLPDDICWEISRLIL